MLRGRPDGIARRKLRRRRDCVQCGHVALQGRIYVRIDFAFTAKMLTQLAGTLSSQSESDWARAHVAREMLGIRRNAITGHANSI